MSLRCSDAPTTRAMLARVAATACAVLPATAMADVAVARPPGPAGYLALGLAMIFIVAALVEWLAEGDDGRPDDSAFEPPVRDDERGAAD